ncbi:DNA polymerase III subunit delta [Paraferrimonas haliotis]|uniref:DNA polymerase III subunit delta n=1 Tax=Paraferrimonas haliotis TaxID=2013866 RepID=UPI000BA8FCFE|nr:DNA polymerase III subunit delta [Paraferrimonas haliotis]
MRIFANQLQQHLQPLKPVYLIFGDDPFIQDQAILAIRAAARKQGFEERVQLSQDASFSWSDLTEEWNALSLFSSKRLFELELPTSKPGKDGSSALLQLLSTPNPDQVLLIHGPKIAPESTKTKWFKSLDKLGVYLPCVTPEGAQFDRWLANQVSQQQLQLTADAQQILNAMYEGNLVAADQAIKQLKLLAPSSVITQQQVEQWLDDQSRFSVFQLTDCLLQGSQSRALHIVKQLQAEGVASQIVLWHINNELSRLTQLKSAQDTNQSLQGLWHPLKIWEKRRPLYQQALSRLSFAQIQAMLAYASNVETDSKFFGEESWTALAHLCLLFDPKAHQQLTPMALH